MENWKKIQKADGNYSVSNYGNVRNDGYSYTNKNGKTLTLKPKIMELSHATKENGFYARVIIRVNGIKKNLPVHILVATQFL